MDLLSLWEKMLANLKQVLPKEIFTNWFEGNIIPYSYSEEENLLILDTMTNFLRDYARKRNLPGKASPKPSPKPLLCRPSRLPPLHRRKL